MGLGSNAAIFGLHSIRPATLYLRTKLHSVCNDLPCTKMHFNKNLFGTILSVFMFETITDKIVLVIKYCIFSSVVKLVNPTKGPTLYLVFLVIVIVIVIVISVMITF